MKSISKISIALAVTALLCAVPLCVTDGTEAYTVKPGETGVSFTADSISDEDAGRLFSDTYRTKMAEEVMGLIVSSGIYFYYQDIEITDVSDYKRSLGSKAENDSRTYFIASGLKLNISFRATCLTGAEFFDLTDGTLDLYRELDDSNRITVGSVLKVSGIYEAKGVMRDTRAFSKNSSGDFVMTEETEAVSATGSFSGDVRYTYKKDATDVTRKIIFDIIRETEFKETFSYDFSGTKIADVTGGTATLQITKDSISKMRERYLYEVNGAKGGADITTDSNDVQQDHDIKAGDADHFGCIMGYDIEVTELSYYDSSGNNLTTIFKAGDVNDAALKDNIKMKEFLAGIGKVGNTYSDADSVADSAGTSIGSGTLSKEIILYVIIGGMAVIIFILLASLIFRRR